MTVVDALATPATDFEALIAAHRGIVLKAAASYWLVRPAIVLWNLAAALALAGLVAWLMHRFRAASSAIPPDAARARP